MHTSRDPSDQTLSPAPRHRSVASQDSNASGIAASAMSTGGESLRLSQFPHPPTEIPSTPLKSQFSTPSPTRSTFSPQVSPLVTSRRHRKATVPSGSRREGSSASGRSPTLEESMSRSLASAILSPHSPASSTFSRPLPRRPFQANDTPPRTPPLTRPLSPDNWNDGVSSIGVDPTEDRLLSTSFITSLLSSTEPSDAESQISGSTYTLPSRYTNFPPPYPTISPSPFQSREASFSSAVPPLASEHDTASITRSTSLSRGFGASMSAIGPAATQQNGESSSSYNSQLHESNMRLGEHPGQDPARFTDGHPDNSKLDVPHLSLGASSVLLSPALPSTSGTQKRFLPDESPKRHHGRQSLYSTKTNKSYVSSFISRVSTSQSAALIQNAFGRRTVKPLPPIPPEAERRRFEERMPMPQLASRANTLEKLLEKGYFPHDGLDSNGKNDEVERGTPHLAEGLPQSPRDDKPKRGNAWNPFNPNRSKTRKGRMSKTTRTIVGACLLTVVVIVVAVSVGVTVTKKRKPPQSSICATCDLDPTCACTSSLPGQCGELANGLISLVPTVNKLFSMDLTPASLSAAIWVTQGAPIGSNCTSQVLLVDVSHALNPYTLPNRTQWAQSALLWNLVQSQDLTAVTKMRTFINNAPWQHLDGSDGPVPDTLSKFEISTSGFTFNFATQTVSQPSVTFVSIGEPTSAQVVQVGNTARTTLDKMYSYALASSTQRQNALATYWRSVLQQRPEDLSVFLSAIRSSPILLPFDATSTIEAGLLTNSTTAPFPPPLGCYPRLNTDQVQRLNTVENSVFGLPPISTDPTNTFNLSCFPDRPLYGVLDILRLRLPFVDSRTGVGRQAAVLRRDVAPRAVIYSGEILSALPGATDLPNITVIQTNPREYGTLSNLNHVILNYLSSIDVNVAIALVTFVLSSHTVPPTNSTILFQSLSSVPTLELAVFGSINPSDISSSVSSFGTSSGSLFFGSDQAAALRYWTITATASSIAWTEFASSPEVVRDSSLNDTTFNSVWNPAFAYLHSPHPGVTVDVDNITGAFEAVGRFVP